MGPLKQIWLYEILGSILLICQNVTVRVCGAWVGMYYVLRPKIYSTLGSLFWTPAGSRRAVKVAEDDIAFKLAIFKKSLHLNDNTCFCSIIQSSKLVLGSLLAKNNFFVQFWTKFFASSRMANCGSGLPAEWPFRSQNAIEASDSPLPGGLWVKRLITHALCSLAYSDIAWCKLFLIFTMKCLYWVFFAYKTPYSVLIDNSIHIQEIDTEKTWLTLQGQIFRCIKHLSVSQLKYLYIVSLKYFR